MGGRPGKACPRPLPGRPTLGLGIAFSLHLPDTKRTMITAERERRGTDRLLTVVGCLDLHTVPVRQRLELEMGGEFARLLVSALAGGGGQGLRARVLRGRSSP